LKNIIDNIYELERLSGKDTYIHKLHPISKIIAALVFIATVASFNRFEIIRLAPYFFYPAVLISAAEIPSKEILKRFAIAAPFCLLAGLNVYALASAIIKSFLCVSAVLILVATAPFTEISSALLKLKVPGVFITIFEIIYRYIGAILEEAYTAFLAYKLRSAKNAKGVAFKDMGVFAGRLLIKSFDRAERVYVAMKLRGYGQNVSKPIRASGKFLFKDFLFCAAVCSLCAIFRLINIYS
jgi:cobalt/nickel transport system permease protein